MTRRVLRAAAYARVSTDQQAQRQTIDSQVEAIRERMAQDGLAWNAELCFSDEGCSGETLERPALERLRDQVAAGAVDRLYVHSPDRLARKYAYQVLLLDEFRRAGVELVFVNHVVDPSPEGELLLQVQGVIAEYERAKILERGRRGRRHAAKRGAVSVFGRAPYGYRYVPKGHGDGEARYEIISEEAAVVRQVYEWFVRDRLALNAIARRLTAADIRTRTGKTRWNVTSVWHILTNPAYQGRACFGRRKVVPRLPRCVALWRAPSPRRPFSVSWTPREEQIEVPVPALVSEEVFGLAQAQLEENRQRSRLGQRGLRHLLQGLLVCPQCGHAWVRQPGSGQKRRHYYRCTGLDSHRWGGQRLCSSRAVRADALEQAVWEDVCALLSDPSRLEQEFRRCLNEAQTTQERATRPVRRLRQRVQQSLSRLIDAYQEGMLTKEEFEPRLQQARTRLAALEREEAAAAAREQEDETLQEVLGQFESFARRIQCNLASADLPTRMKLVRWLVKHIEVHPEEVRIIYKVSPPPFDQDPCKRELQDHPRCLGCWQSGPRGRRHGSGIDFQFRPAACPVLCSF